jgi:hypothetical protein
VKSGDLLLTCRQFNDLINQTSHSLLAVGARKGERVAGLLTTGNEFQEILFVGAILVPPKIRSLNPDCCRSPNYVGSNISQGKKRLLI